MRALVFALALASVCAAEPVETAHYRLHHAGADAAELSRVLEAAYAGFAKFFGAEPKEKDKLVVRFFEKREEWAKAIIADRAVPPADAGGYYWPDSKTAYLYRQPTRYYTRALLIHEAAHQFHYLARTRNSQPKAYWYSEGVAEYLCEHHWDGEQLTLGVLAMANLRDYPKKALVLAANEGFKLQDFVEGKQHATSRPLGWALYRYLLTGGKDGKPLKGVAKWQRKMDGGNTPGPIFKKTFGRGKKAQEAFVTWLRGEQQTWTQIWNEWYPVGENALHGVADVVSACRPKEPASVIKATLHAPTKGRWMAGILLHYESGEDYSVALLDWGGFLRIQRRVGKGWQTIERGPGPPKPKDGKYKLQAFRKKGKVYLMVGADGYGPWELPGNVLGLALDRGAVTFSDIDWK
ncbi:MAG: hypothetical protein ACYTGN_00700 [Planctomycetota bacterium]|jgi:hypothetical protein